MLPHNDNHAIDVASNSSQTRTPTLGRRRRVLAYAGIVALGLLAVTQGAARAHFFAPNGEAGAHGPGGPGEHHMAKRMERLLDAAGASDDQRARVRTVWENLRPQLRTAHQEHATVHRQIAEAMAAPTIDRARIEQLRKQAVQTMDRTSALMTQGMVASAEVLTPEQRQKVLAEMGKHRFRGGHGHGRDQGAPGTPTR